MWMLHRYRKPLKFVRRSLRRLGALVLPHSSFGKTSTPLRMTGWLIDYLKFLDSIKNQPRAGGAGINYLYLFKTATYSGFFKSSACLLLLGVKRPSTIHERKLSAVTDTRSGKYAWRTALSFLIASDIFSAA